MSVKIYTTPSCGYCSMAKSYLRERHISFTEYNVASDQRKAEELVHKTGQYGVPVIEINGRMIIGFNKEKIDRLLAG
ncbi:MAG: glutathione S-transferase N-terminal domain-containing protein [Spirochaetes bacterium]|nr:glutathione S-transferase N-terminal domain-containing protein [Spirochaetota bacterium]